MRWLFALLLTTSCAAATPRAPLFPDANLVSDAAPVVTSTNPIAAVAHKATTRREEPYARIQGAKLVTEIDGDRCTYGLETPIGPGMVSTKSGVWLVMPSAACEGAPDVHRTTDFILWRGAGMTSIENTSPEDRASALGAPIEFLSPRDGMAVASTLLDALPPLPSTSRSKHRLAILDENGRPITNRAVLRSLCENDNPDACYVAGASSSAPDRRALLERSCRLGDDDGCYMLGLDLRAAALAAIRNAPEVRELLGFTRGVGRRTSLTPILTNEAASCPAASTAVVAK